MPVVNKDAFSSSQLGSKIWLCEELERLGWDSDHTCIYAGWYGVVALLLLSRGKFAVKKIRSIDLDPTCERIADMFNEYWVWQNWRFKAITADCNNYRDPDMDLVINTSTEHFQSQAWWDNIPMGTRVVLQGNNMPHDDHFTHSHSALEFAAEYNLSQVDFLGAKEFVYPDWSFSRFMVIGTK
jgi:hypothetical protein